MNVTFDAIAGYSKEKKRLREICDLLKNSKTLRDMGIRPPSGILLIGEPGVGKTVMAEALIAESGLPCVRLDSDACDGENAQLSEYLGKLAERARAESPCILFADELDKLLGQEGFRGPSYDMDGTRAFLHMMDSLKGCDVTVMAIVNDEDMLNRAVRRSGRFDRVLHVGMPGVKDRREILRYYAEGKPMASGIKYDLLARECQGMSGADLECVMNDAGLYAVSCHRRKIRQSDVEYAMECKLFQGVEHESGLTPEQTRVVAVHEVGHAVLTLAFCPKDLGTVTLLPFGEAMGHVHTAQQEFPTKEWFEHKLAMLLAGRAAEQLFFPGTVFSGSSDDLMKAYGLAEHLVKEEGMYGLEYLSTVGGRPYRPPVSEQKMRETEMVISSLLAQAEETAASVLAANRALMERLIAKLMTAQTLSVEQIMALVGREGVRLGNGSDTLESGAEKKVS